MFEQILEIHRLVSEGLILADSSSDEGGPMFWLLGPLGGAGFYAMIFMRYRNTNKRHAYESKTVSEIGQIFGTDTKVGVVRGTSNPNILGENSTKPRTRLGANSVYTETWRKS